MDKTGDTMQDNLPVDAKNAIIIAPEQPKQEAHPNLNKGNYGNNGNTETKYDIKYCDAIIEFFSIPKKVRYIKRERIKTNKDGSKDVYYEYAYMPNELPTIDKFADSIGVTDATIVNWATARYPDNYEIVEKRGKLKRPKFFSAYKRAKVKQKEFLTDNGLEGLYNPVAFVFVANNFTDMRAQKPVEPPREEKESEIPILGGLSKQDAISSNNSNS